MSKKVKEKRVVITGIGCMSSLGLGKEENWEALLNHKKTRKRITEREFVDKSYYAYKSKEFKLNKFINEEILKDIENWKEGERGKDLEFLIMGIHLALEDSKLKYNKTNNDVGIVAMHENPGLNQYVLNLSSDLFEYFNRHKKVDKSVFFNRIISRFTKSTFELQTFMFLYHLAKVFSLHGASFFINNACASGLYGIEMAANLIRSNKCNAVVVAAADTLDFLKQIWFEKLGMYSKKGKITPFSQKSDGFVLGEGGGALILENFEYAKRRGASIYAEYKGGSFCLEGWKITIPAVWSDFYEKVISNSIKISKIKKDGIDLISPHGVGVSIVDKYEQKSIRKVFGIKKSPYLLPFKPAIGHTLGTNNIIETIFLLLCMKNNKIPGAYYTNDLYPGLNIPTTNISGSFNIGVKTCCAFGGYLASCVFEKIK